MTHLISYKMNHIYIIYLHIIHMYMIITMMYIYIYTIIVIAHVLLGSMAIIVFETLVWRRRNVSLEATSMVLRCWKCPQLGPSCTPSPFDETIARSFNARNEKTGVRTKFVKKGPSFTWVSTLWWTNIAMERSTIFNGKIHYKWPFSIAMLVHQRVWWFSTKKIDFMGFHRPSWFSSLGDSYGLWLIYRTSSWIF